MKKYHTADVFAFLESIVLGFQALTFYSMTCCHLIVAQDALKVVIFGIFEMGTSLLQT